MGRDQGLQGVAVLAAAAVLGCSAPADGQAQDGADAEAAFSPYGAWRIVSVDGVPAVVAFDEVAAPSVSFRQTSYGGSSGCNGFGATGVWVEGRWYGDWPMMTAMACPSVGDQESRITRVLASAPRIRPLEDGRIEVASDRGVLILEPLEPDPARTGPDEPPPALLAGRSWDLRGQDGQSASGLPEATLAFGADQWTLTSACGASSGDWDQAGQAVRFEFTRVAEGCGADPRHQAMQGLTAGAAGIATGWNGEMVLGGSGHWLLGWRSSGDPAATVRRLAGSWEAVQLNGEALTPGDAGVRVAFGPGGYSLWDGCNQTEGLALVVDGDLFTAASGVSTLARCEADETRSAARAVVLASPRVAWAEDGVLVLVSRGGTLRLRRLDAQAFGDPRSPGLRSGQTIDLDGGGVLSLQAGGRFTLTTSCSEMTGQWRGGAQPRFSPEPPRETQADCDLGPGSAAFRASQILIGDVQAAVDANGERVLIASQGQALTGRIRR